MVLAACATRCPPRKARGRRFGGQPEPVHKTAMLPVACRMPEYQALGTKGGSRRRHPPHGPQALSSQKAHGWYPHGLPAELASERDCSPLETLGYHQPRDSHVHGSPDVRANFGPALTRPKWYARGGLSLIHI